MRPRELTLKGFRSYRDETTLCWDDRSLVGIVGPIGSGKSSILDAISFALYNQTPRVARDTKSLINQRRESAQVSLTFDVDGATYRAVRSLRRNGASAHALYRVEDGAEVPVADRAAPMLDEIQRLLGLDFQAFQRSVLLAQNQFAGFLEATETDRDKVLKGVFGFERLDRMRAVTKARLDALASRFAHLKGLMATAETDRADLAQRRLELEAAEERARSLEDLRAPFEQTKEVISAARRRQDEARATLARLDAMAHRIPDGDTAASMLGDAGEAAGRVEQAAVAVEEAVEARRGAAAALDDVLAPIGGRAGLDRAADLTGAWKATVEARTTADAETVRSEERAALARRRVEEAADTAERAALAAADAAAREEAAHVDTERCEAALAAATQSHRAHALRSELVVGDPCPVCEQVVGRLPEGDAPDSVETARRDLDTARSARADASVAARAAADARAHAAAGLEAARAAVLDAEAAVQAAGDVATRAADEQEAARVAAAQLLGDGDPADALADMRAAAAAATAALEAAAAAETEARTALDTARSTARSTDERIGSLRAEIAAVAGSIGVEISSGSDREAVSSSLREVRTAWIEQRAAADAAVLAAGEELTVAEAARAELLEAAGLGRGDDVAEVVAAAVAERSGREAAVALLEKRVADLAALSESEDELTAHKELLERLHADLAPSRFLGFVLDERRRILADLASEHFETLSAGRYRFDDSGEFLVVDLTAADAVRAPASLSGGETFLASLALAMALAEIVSREGGRLDAFFLDEGFGSLGPQHLDLAMEGVERLVTAGTDRLVVVVSHVPAMRERMEDLIVLDPDPATGDTRVVSGGGCP